MQVTDKRLHPQLLLKVSYKIQRYTCVRNTKLITNIYVSSELVIVYA